MVLQTAGIGWNLSVHWKSSDRFMKGILGPVGKMIPDVLVVMAICLEEMANILDFLFCLLIFFFEDGIKGRDLWGMDSIKHLPWYFWTQNGEVGGGAYKFINSINQYKVLS